MQSEYSCIRSDSIKGYHLIFASRKTTQMSCCRLPFASPLLILSMTTEPGQVYLVDLGMAAKARPMLVVSRRDKDLPRALAVCAPITTSTRESQYEVCIGKPRFLHEQSYVNVQGMQAIQHHELKRMIGRVPDADLQKVKGAIEWLFDIDARK